MPDLCGQPHHTWPETRCTEPAGHYRPGTDPHAGPLIINGRQRGGCAWDEPDVPNSAGPAAETPNEPAAPVAAPASGLRDTLATWLRTHALDDLEDPAVIDSLTATLQGLYVPPPPGSDRDALPEHLRPLIAPHMPRYESTACQTERACQAAAREHPEHAEELLAWADREHLACRRTRKQDMAPCSATCHTKENQ